MFEWTAENAQFLKGWSIVMAGVMPIIAIYNYVKHKRRPGESMGHWIIRVALYPKWGETTEETTSGSRSALPSAVLDLGDGDVLLWSDLFANTLVMGPPGSGKTSGALKALARAMLQAGVMAAAGFWYCVKSDEIEHALAVCKAAGRLNDVVLFAPGNGFVFPALQYEWDRTPKSVRVQATASFIMAQKEVQSGQAGQGHEKNGEFWEAGQRQLYECVLIALDGAGEGISYSNILRCVDSIPADAEEMKSEQWGKTAYLHGVLQAWSENRVTPDDHARWELVSKFLLVEFPGLPPETKGGFQKSVTSLLYPFSMPGNALHDLFCSTNGKLITPKMVIDQGLIFINAMPTKVFHEAGIQSNIIVRQSAQRECERRTIGANTRPVVMMLDEYPSLATEKDIHSFETLRSKKVAHALGVQNPSTLRMRFSGARGKEAVDALGSLIANKFFCACSAHDATWACEQIGKSLQDFDSGSTGLEPEKEAFLGLMGGQSRQNAGFSSHYEMEIQPQTLTRLRRGGPRNNFLVDSLYVRSGDPLTNGKTYKFVTFDQRS